jgi:catechol 2,3-dioxygenase-like lactoylglutathione lyase family enzyme
MSLGLHHTCISVADLNSAAEWYKRTLGFETQTRFQIPNGGAVVEMLGTPGGARVELSQPASNSEGNAWKSTAESLETRGLTHIAFEVEDLEATYDAAIAAGAQSARAPMSGMDGHRMAFLHDNEGNLIELFLPAAS